MRRSEAHQGVRMIELRDVLCRYEAAELWASGSGRSGAASAATTRTVPPWNPKKPPESARRPACGRPGQACDFPPPAIPPGFAWRNLWPASPTPTTGEQNQTKRTYDVLPKPARLISYRYECSLIPTLSCSGELSRSQNDLRSEAVWGREKGRLRDPAFCDVLAKLMVILLRSAISIPESAFRGSGSATFLARSQDPNRHPVRWKLL